VIKVDDLTTEHYAVCSGGSSPTKLGVQCYKALVVF